MKYTEEDNNYKYFEGNFQGNTIRISQDKQTNDIFFNTDDVTFNEFLGSDEGLDLINEWNRTHPNKPFFGNAVKKT